MKKIDFFLNIKTYQMLLRRILLRLISSILTLFANANPLKVVPKSSKNNSI
jgi:hypothetical protein